MFRRGLTRCLCTAAAAAAARRASFTRFSSPPISGVRLASPSSAPLSGEDFVYGELPPTPPPPKAASIPALLQPRVVIYDGVCHLCHRGASSTCISEVAPLFFNDRKIDIDAVVIALNLFVDRILWFFYVLAVLRPVPDSTQCRVLWDISLMVINLDYLI